MFEGTMPCAVCPNPAITPLGFLGFLVHFECHQCGYSLFRRPETAEELQHWKEVIAKLYAQPPLPGEEEDEYNV